MQCSTILLVYLADNLLLHTSGQCSVKSPRLKVFLKVVNYFWKTLRKYLIGLLKCFCPKIGSKQFKLASDIKKTLKQSRSQGFHKIIVFTKNAQSIKSKFSSINVMSNSIDQSECTNIFKKSKNDLGQKVLNQLKKQSQIDFSTECFTADFVARFYQRR